jgi:signal transduction histidine kinase
MEHGPDPGLPRRRSLSTWLLIPLLATVASIMTAFAIWALVQRERTLLGEARRETQAYATALGLALDAAFRDPERSGVPEIVDRITEQPSIYAVLVYDADGAALFRPDTLNLGPTPPQVDTVLAEGAPREVERALGDVDVYSVVYPIRGPGGAVVGAFEVAQPLSFVRQEMGRTRGRFLLNTLVLFLAVTALIQWLVRRLVAGPLRQLSEGVRALGGGRLEHRIRLGGASGELADVAAEFNRMAHSLEQARVEVMRGAEERLALARHVRHSEKMAAIGQLAAGLAHEVGAPLHVIRGRADLLARRSTRSDPEARDLRIIVEQIDRITGIVRGLLDFTRQREPLLAPLELGGVAGEVLELLAAETRRSGVEVLRRVEGDDVVMGDKDQLQQVVLNLLLNAIQALGEVEGPRTIRLDVAPSVDERGQWVRLLVTDNGVGIPEESRDRIFEPFFTTKATGAGTGLGLAVARRIAEEHGGSLQVLPATDGTTIELRLPAAPGHDHGE